ncbi:MULTISPECIES: TolC family protein [Acinetobacter]|uniref:TolC family protein n=1 Tax=Acinetobacter johnsonii TaxID=40214 RepID=A0AAJ6LD11_ACIJO|nr:MULTISPECIES: TolC family protein [Acinetobacter]ALV73210.1 RND transporter [Acinetobacter johnsonii XBB1]MCV2452912.1 TolC family protein [Acinetobacter johnsonii]MDH1533962.1 TolC family protein [Acinetobacter johnsonii]MDH1727760.1 TolC family protein [Acinetobacter johnsonii]MWC20275.1 RND transporter [Acinetobacter johnsonii]
MKKKEMIRSELKSESIFLMNKWSIAEKRTYFICMLKSSGFWHSSLYLSLVLLFPVTFASANTEQPSSVKSKINQIWQPKPDDQANTIKIDDFNRLFTNTSSVQELPKISAAVTTDMPSSSVRTVAVTKRSQLDFLDAIRQALQRRPEITQGIAEVAQQQANIDTVKSQYFPQISGGFNTGDFTTGERGRQVFSISATQMLYDFGKIKSAVTVEQAKLMQDQAQLLLEIDDISYQVANAIVNIKRYEELVKIADQQISGIGRIAEIARLRAQAGISSQADPIQAQSNLEAAQSTKVVQEAQLHQYQQKLRTLLGYDVSNVNINMPSFLVEKAGLYDEIDFNNVSKMMAAQTAVQIAKFQKQQTKLNVYPTLNIKGSLSQAVNGRNPNNNEDDGFYNSIMLEASSTFFQGGAISARNRAASYAEEAAKAQVSTVYLDVLDQTRLIQTEVESKQKQMVVLAQRRETTKRTKELYQEQYKLGTRTVVDLLNAEQAIHGAAQEIEAARYDIYTALIRYIEITGRSRAVYQLNNTPIQGLEVVS